MGMEGRDFGRCGRFLTDREQRKVNSSGTSDTLAYAMKRKRALRSRMKPNNLETLEPILETQVWGVGILYVVAFPVLLVMLVVGAIRVS